MCMWPFTTSLIFEQKANPHIINMALATKCLISLHLLCMVRRGGRFDCAVEQSHHARYRVACPHRSSVREPLGPHIGPWGRFPLVCGIFASRLRLKNWELSTCSAFKFEQRSSLQNHHAWDSCTKLFFIGLSFLIQ